jgi:cell wall-associated NlpC family hydrolase
MALTDPGTPIQEVLQAYMIRLVGTPYRWGGDDPIQGFDCSGLAQELLASVGMDPPGDQTAQALHDYFSKNNLGSIKACGALVFYGKSATEITHIGMLLDSIHIVEAGGGGSSTTTLDAAAKQNAFVRIRRFDHRKDVVSVMMPRYGYMK